MADLVMELAGVDMETAEKALAEHKEVWLAVDALLVKPVVSGEKYVRAKPVFTNDLSEEQAALCKRGRWLQDQVNAVFSVAHSQTLRPQGDLQEVESVDLPQLDDSAAVTAPPSSPSPPQDAPEKMTPEDSQS
jgi:hypothetical protein